VERILGSRRCEQEGCSRDQQFFSHRVAPYCQSPQKTTLVSASSGAFSNEFFNESGHMPHCRLKPVAIGARDASSGFFSVCSKRSLGIDLSSEIIDWRVNQGRNDKIY